MTRDPIDLDRLQALADRVETAGPADALRLLRRAVLDHGGRWDLPGETPGTYEPAIVSVQVFGVFGMAEDIEALPTNWCRAARNILAAADSDERTTA